MQKGRIAAAGSRRSPPSLMLYERRFVRLTCRQGGWRGQELINRILRNPATALSASEFRKLIEG